MSNTDLFKALDKVIFDYKDRLNPAEFFRLISEYQLSRIDKIEESNNKQQRVALFRTSMYDTTTLEAYKKTTSEKKKLSMVFKLVNLLCIANSSLKAVESSAYDKEIFDIILSHKDKILGNKDWYLSVIPESKWLIEYMENCNDNT